MKKWTFSIILIVFAFFLGQKANEKTGVLNESIFANVVVNPKSDTLLQIETSFLNSGCHKEFADLINYYYWTSYPTDSECLLCAIIAVNLYHTASAGKSVFRRLAWNDIYDFNNDFGKLDAYCLMHEIGEDYLKRSASANDYNAMQSIWNEKSCRRDFYDSTMDSLSRKYDIGYLSRMSDTMYKRNMQLHEIIHKSSK